MPPFINRTQYRHKSDLYEHGTNESYADKTSGLKYLLMKSLHSSSLYKWNFISGFSEISFSKLACINGGKSLVCQQVYTSNGITLLYICFGTKLSCVLLWYNPVFVCSPTPRSLRGCALYLTRNIILY